MGSRYEDATAMILAGLGSELEADIKLFGTRLESESERVTATLRKRAANKRHPAQTEKEYTTWMQMIHGR